MFNEFISKARVKAQEFVRTQLDRSAAAAAGRQGSEILDGGGSTPAVTSGGESAPKATDNYSGAGTPNEGLMKMLAN